MAKNINLNSLIPSALKNETLTSLVSNVFNRFVSEERSVSIEGRIGRQITGDAPIPTTSLDRELNALVPAVNYTLGSEEIVFTFSDMVNRLKAINADIANMQDWMKEQSFNYTLPIDYDKFINYSSYYWVAGDIQNQVVGRIASNISNPSILPEYYTIQKPLSTDVVKMPAYVATTRHVNLYANDRPPETFTITFQSSTDFVISSDLGSPIILKRTTSGVPVSSLISTVPFDQSVFKVYTADTNTGSPALDDVNLSDDYICSFAIENGTASFQAGDVLKLTIDYFTSNIAISNESAVTLGKGIITSASSTSSIMAVDGYRLFAGARVLVCQQNNPAENGLYDVTIGGKWQRSNDARLETEMELGSKIFVQYGIANTLFSYEITSKTSLGVLPSGLINSEIVFTRSATTTVNPVNQWQELNFWVHQEDMIELGFDPNNCIKANRPIIEYNRLVQLNSGVDDGYPSSDTAYSQIKTKRNQIPKFDLFRYDGTPENAVSGIFFYVEDPDFPIDVELGRRAKLTSNGDYVFGTGLSDSSNRLLYYKKAGVITSIWQAGVEFATPTSMIYSGANNGTITFQAISSAADNQDWTITCTSSLQFSVQGSRSGSVGTATVGAQFTCDDFIATINPGSFAYSVGNKFTFSIQAPVYPRYVTKLADGSVVNFPGGAVADESEDTTNGTWLTPLRMFQNLERETRNEINFGDLLNHFRNIIRNQDGFSGTSFGSNNFRKLNFDSGLGGTIRDFNSNFPLLTSMLLQKDLSPITFIDFAETQQSTALASINQFIADELVDFITEVESINLATIDQNSAQIQALLKRFEARRASNLLLNEVFKDSTALIPNWPASLPMLGLVAPVVPTEIYDAVLNQYAIAHHDGHLSTLAVNSADVNRAAAQIIVERSNGTKSAGVFGSVPPANPYARQLWFNSTNAAVSMFDVVSDTDETPLGATGDYWYKRSTDQVFEWSSSSSNWVLSSTAKSALWTKLDIANIKNSLLLAVEQRLYDSVHIAQQINYDLSSAVNSIYAETELAQFAIKHKLDIYASDYLPFDAFTWNYKASTIAGLIGDTPARWFNVYLNYTASFAGVIPTARPDLEPWHFVTNHFAPSATKPTSLLPADDWDSVYASPSLTISGTEVNADTVATNNVALFGLYSINGYTVTSGDRVLVTAQSIPQTNGIYIAAAGGWARATDSLTFGLPFRVQQGDYANSLWVITTNSIVINSTPISIEQSRTWIAQMWLDIKAANPSLRLGVNINTDELLPPYVSPFRFESAEALTTEIPLSRADDYTFGDDGPTETVWKKSIEYRYGLVRSSFKLSPMEFLDATWGETYCYSGLNNRVERNLMAPLPASSMLVHGEKLNIINELSQQELLDRIKVDGFISNTLAGKVEFVVSHCADNITIFDMTVNNVKVSSGIVEGQPFTSPTFDGITFSNVTIDDLGIPFELGTRITFNFFADIVIPSPTDLLAGCEGCVSPGDDIPSSATVIPVPYTVSYAPARVKIFKGLGQWFTHFLRFSYIDTDVSAATVAYNGWTVKLAHRLGAMIRPDTLKINTTLGLLPPTAYKTVLKTSNNIDGKWFSGLRIQLVEIGANRLDANGKPAKNDYDFIIPPTDGSDWVFRIESYNPRHPEVERYVLDTAGEYQTFFALQKQRTDLEWKRYTSILASNGLVKTAMPITITGVQNVADFIFGYERRLRDLGWKLSDGEVSSIDAETGRNLDWQLEVEKFIDRVYGGLSTGQGHIANPSTNRITIQTPKGILSKFSTKSFMDVDSTQALYDVIGTRIPINQLQVLRTDDATTVYSNTPIYSGLVFTDEYEHTILLNSKVAEGDYTTATIFDSFLGMRIDSAFLNFIKHDADNMKPTFDGFFLSGDDVKRNVTSSVATIPKFFDPNQTFLEPTTAEHATASIGFSKKNYFEDLGISDATQFNFWRGLIQAKGTNMSINAFVNYDKFIDASVDEFWAYKLAEYGDAREKTFPEIKISPADVSQSFTKIQFYSESDQNYSPIPLFAQIENDDSSRWYSLDDLGKGMKFEAQKISESFSVSASDTFPKYVKLKNIYHNVEEHGPKVTKALGINTATIVNATTVKVLAEGNYTVNGYTWLNPSKLSPVKLFDYEADVLVDEIGLWHPAIGVHAANPLQIIDIISKNNPAAFGYTTKTSSNVNFNTIKPWGEREIGKVWWDTSNLGYVPYYDATIFTSHEARLSRWGKLADWSSVDLYTWTASSVHPKEYDAKAIMEENDSSINADERATGRAALEQIYSRERTVTMKPIAWSQSAESATSNPHPQFGPATFTKIYIGGNTLIADTGRTVDIGLTTGRIFGGWHNEKPVGEVSITGNITYAIGSSLTPDSASLNPTGTISSLELTALDDTFFGTKIGELTLKKVNTSGYYSLRMLDATGYYEDVEMTDWYSDDEQPTYKIFKYSSFGVQLKVFREGYTLATGPILSAETLCDDIVSSFTDVVIRETVSFTKTIDLPANIFINDTADLDFSTTDTFEWRSWDIPTADDLASDLLAPKNIWKPYVGDEVAVVITPAVIKAMTSEKPFVLRSGETINRYSSSWSAWSTLDDSTVSLISDGVNAIEYEFADLENDLGVTRVSVYVNGSQINPATYVISGKSIQLVNTLSEGTELIILNRAYAPSATELAFDPDVKDDFTFLTQFKKDYEYSKIDVRDSDGNITGSTYYFWVKDKSIVEKNKNMTLKQAQISLTSGPTAYVTFSRLKNYAGAISPIAFDSCAIAGLAKYVSKLDAFKLRFLRNFTLRDDPEEMDLKNVHTEWALIRKNQASRIPKSLWDKLTDAISGIDIAGSTLPSKVRSDYDATFNTNYRFGFKQGQIFADTALVKDTVINTILNTQQVIDLGYKKITDYISALDLTKSADWFSTPNTSRATMNLIWNTARAGQINEIFFNVLDDALANNYEFGDIFKTSFITVSATTSISEGTQTEQTDELY